MSADDLRTFPQDLVAVFDKLSLDHNVVICVYLIGSRMWGTATTSSDYDLYIVIKGSDSARNSHFKLPGVDVDAVVIGATSFQGRIDQGKLKELSCIWAPKLCRLVETVPFRPSGKSGLVNKAALLGSLLEGYKKDWTRARKLIESAKLVQGKKVLAHCVRAHLLAQQIVDHGKIEDYLTGGDVVAFLHGKYDKDWETYQGLFQEGLLKLQQYIKNVVSGGSDGVPIPAATAWFNLGSAEDASAHGGLCSQLADVAQAATMTGKVGPLQKKLQEVIAAGVRPDVKAVVAAQSVLDALKSKRERAAQSRNDEMQITNYPSTMHLPFSPTVHSDDIQVRHCIISSACLDS